MSSKSDRDGRQAGDSGKSYISSLKAGILENQEEFILQMKSKGSLLSEFPFAWRVGEVSFPPSTDWMRPTHILKGGRLYSESADFCVNLIPKHPHRNIQSNVGPNIRALWPSQVDTCV